MRRPADSLGEARHATHPFGFGALRVGIRGEQRTRERRDHLSVVCPIQRRDRLRLGGTGYAIGDRQPAPRARMTAKPQSALPAVLLPAVLRSAHAQQAASAERVRRFQEMEIPRCGHAHAPGHPTWPVGARARFAASLHQGRHARAGRRASADAVLEHPLVRDAQAMTDELPVKVVRSNGTDEVLARAINLLIARAPGRVRKERLGATRPTEPKLARLSPQTNEACGYCGSGRRFMTSSGKTSLKDR
jgi:hypothetical protein